jgi:pimeloyl-ACP methyl ester carboxylesterase
MNITTSRDGTVIAYRTCGSGPSVIVVPGCMSTVDTYARFAAALGRSFTVHTIERRGRGRSGPQGTDYGLTKEIEDFAAVRDETGARLAVGHSYGGLIVLEAARVNPKLDRLAVYEPGVSVNGGLSVSWAPAYRDHLARGRPADAMVDIAHGLGPRAVRMMPRWMLKAGINLAMSPGRRREMFALLPSNLVEHEECARYDDTYPNYREVSARVLLMQGGKAGTTFAGAGIAKLAEVLPDSRTTTFPKLGHFGMDRQAPGEVARNVATFFST